MTDTDADDEKDADGAPCCTAAEAEWPDDEHGLPADFCNARGRGLLCTRPAGHDGEHKACEPNRHEVETWEGDRRGARA